MDNNNPKRSRKFLLTFNNPKEHGYTHEMINTLMKNFKYEYYCLCDEIGEKGTYHTHLFFQCKNAVDSNKVNKIFPNVHYDIAHGSAEDCRNYLRKEGKYLNSDKKDTNLIDTFEEYGDLPLCVKSKNAQISEQVLEMIDNGCSILDVVRCFPSYATKINQLETIRQEFLKEKYNNQWTDRKVTYIYGDTGTGKTRSVMEKYGYSNVYKVTNYQHPFDNYKGEEVLLLDEYKGQLPLSDLLQYSDGYPCNLPSRYQDKVACYKEVYIISNSPLNQLYKDVQRYDSETWNAFIRRISKVIRFERNNGDYPFTAETEVVQVEESKEQYIIKGV